MTHSAFLIVGTSNMTINELKPMYQLYMGLLPFEFMEEVKQMKLRNTYKYCEIASSSFKGNIQYHLACNFQSTCNCIAHFPVWSIEYPIMSVAFIPVHLRLSVYGSNMLYIIHGGNFDVLVYYMHYIKYNNYI